MLKSFEHLSIAARIEARDELFRMRPHSGNDSLNCIQDRLDVPVGESRGNEADDLPVGRITVPVDELDWILAHMALPGKTIEKLIQMTLQTRREALPCRHTGPSGEGHYNRKGALMRRPFSSRFSLIRLNARDTFA